MQGMDSRILLYISAIITYLFCLLRFTRIPLTDWVEVGYYATRDTERLSRMELRLLPYLTGVPNVVPLYKHRHSDTWAYRVRDGPWINPTPDDIHRYAVDENGEPLLG
jgi:hypothetical protein